MTYQEAKEIEGKFGEMEFYLTTKKSNERSYFELHGTVVLVEKKNLLFRCNHDHDFIVALRDISNFNEILRKKFVK